MEEDTQPTDRFEFMVHKEVHDSIISLYDRYCATTVDSMPFAEYVNIVLINGIILTDKEVSVTERKMGIV
jgi:hypothetical protein